MVANFIIAFEQTAPTKEKVSITLTCNYIERQKKHHFFRATLTKIQTIKMKHIWTQFSYSNPYQTNLKKHTFVFKSKRVKWGEIGRGHFKKNTQKLLVSRPQSSARTKASTAVT